MTSKPDIESVYFSNCWLVRESIWNPFSCDYARKHSWLMKMEFSSDFPKWFGELRGPRTYLFHKEKNYIVRLLFNGFISEPDIVSLDILLNFHDFMIIVLFSMLKKIKYFFNWNILIVKWMPLILDISSKEHFHAC